MYTSGHGALPKQARAADSCSFVSYEEDRVPREGIHRYVTELRVYRGAAEKKRRRRRRKKRKRRRRRKRLLLASAATPSDRVTYGPVQ